MKSKLFTLFIVTLFAYAKVWGQNSFTQINPNTERRIDDLLESLSLQEKIGQTCQITLDAILKKNELGQSIEPPAIDEKKLAEAMQSYGVGSVLNVGSHSLTLDEWKKIHTSIHSTYVEKKVSIPVLYGIDAIHGVNYTVGGTLFPHEIGLAATWNPDLAFHFGQVTAYETRASGIPWNFSPVLDIARQPLWSRFFETLGEDPYLAAEIGGKIVEGYQGRNGEKTGTHHVASCLKHFVGYGIPLSGRDRTPAWIPEKYMQELCLPAFKEAIEKGAMTVMINSGDVNGIPGHINQKLLTQTLKNEWGFKGFTVSDWEDFILLHSVHKVAVDTLDAVVKAFNAGVDMSMVPNSPQYMEYCKLMEKAINTGRISEDRLNDAVRRILRVKIAVGLFEKNMGMEKNYPKFNSIEHKDLSYKAALESITLLKNTDKLLPLKKNMKVLIAGPTANGLNFLNGAWTHTWQGTDTAYNTKNCKTIYESIREKVGDSNCSFEIGAELFYQENFEDCRLKNIEKFEEKLTTCDAVVLCLGELPGTEKPGDIKSLQLHPAQLELAERAYASKKPVILILVEGRPRIIHPIVEQSAAILQLYLPGDYGGEALASILFGEENPSGKLPYTYPKFDGVIEFYDHPFSVDRSKTNTPDAYSPEFDFGFGLSYSQFDYSNLTLSKASLSINDSLEVSVHVKNNSNREGKEVVQLYVSDDVCSLVPAGKRLKRFEKIALKPFEEKIVTFQLSQEDFKFANPDGKWAVEPGSFSIQVGKLKEKFILQ